MVDLLELMIDLKQLTKSFCLFLKAFESWDQLSISEVAEEDSVVLEN